MRQHRIAALTELLDEQGRLVTPGYATSMLYRYRRDRVRPFPFRLKEWDFYQFVKGDDVLQLTLGHVSYMCAATATLFNIKTKERHSLTSMRPFFVPKLDEDPDKPSLLDYQDKRLALRFETSEHGCDLTFKNPDGVDIHITIPNETTNDKMVVAIPFSNKRQFYLNAKENFYDVKGYARFQDRAFSFDEATGVLDWGRGVWPYSHEWFWGSLSTHLGAVPFGLNVGWRFGKTEKANENMFFVNRHARKLGRLIVKRDVSDYMKPWKLTDEDGLIDLTFSPLYDNDTRTDFLFVKTRCHQLWGHFTGTVITKEGMTAVGPALGFIEHAVNRW